MKVMGYISVTMGVLLTVYLVWALFFDTQPRTNNNPYSAILLVAMMFVVGMKWIRGEKIE
jgi:hypothetical protein